MLNLSTQTHTIRCFLLKPVVTLSLAASLLALVAVTTAGNLPGIGSRATPAALPQAYVSANAGEGRVGPTISRSATTFQAHAAVHAGEGLVGPTVSRSISTLQARIYPYAGEGVASAAALRAAATRWGTPELWTL